MIKMTDAPTVPAGWTVRACTDPDTGELLWELNSETDPHAGGWIVPIQGIPTEQYKVAYRCSDYDYLSDGCMPDWYTDLDQVLEGVVHGTYQFHKGGDVNACARKLTGPLG